MPRLSAFSLIFLIKLNSLAVDSFVIGFAESPGGDDGNRQFLRDVEYLGYRILPVLLQTDSGRQLESRTA